MGSVEFRLCREHFGRQLHYDTYTDSLILSRLADISMQLAQGRLEKQSMISISKSYDAQNEYAASILDPVKFEKLVDTIESGAKNTDENKAAYLSTLTDGTPFTSIDAILGSINELNSKIAKRNANS